MTSQPKWTRNSKNAKPWRKSSRKNKYVFKHHILPRWGFTGKMDPASITVQLKHRRTWDGEATTWTWNHHLKGLLGKETPRRCTLEQKGRRPCWSRAWEAPRLSAPASLSKVFKSPTDTAHLSFILQKLSTKSSRQHKVNRRHTLPLHALSHTQLHYPFHYTTI